jgi:transcriptional regulator with XRE-family HTH domain
MSIPVLNNKALKTAMQMKGMTAQILADKIGVSEATIYQYMSGARTPTLKHLSQICEVLGIKDVNQILNENKPEIPKI